MTFSPQLRIPGPTPLPERVMRAMARPMVDHRGPEFAAVFTEVTEGAKKVFKTRSDVLLLTASGSGGLESAIANQVSPGDRVIACVCYSSTSTKRPKSLPTASRWLSVTLGRGVRFRPRSGKGRGAG